MSIIEKFVGNCDLSDLSVNQSKPKKPWTVKDILENPDNYYGLIFTEGDSFNLSIRKRPETEEKKED